MNKQSKNNNNRKKSRKNVRGLFPKQLSIIPVQNRTIRYRSTGTVPLVQIYRRDVLNLINAVSAASTAPTALLGAVRVVSIEMFAFSASGDTTLNNVSADITWISNNGPDTRLEDIGNSARPAHILTRAPRSSLASFWSNANSTLGEILFTVNTNATVATIVDLHFQFTLNDGSARVLTSALIASANVIYNNLDNSTAIGGAYGSSNLVPAGLTNVQAWG